MNRSRIAELLRELADEIERGEEDEPYDMPYVCPECHCVGDARHAPGCFDGEMEEDRRNDFQSDDEDGDSDDYDHVSP